MPTQPVPFDWQQIDQTLANLMLGRFSQDIRKIILDDEQHIYYHNIGNGNSVAPPSQRLEMQLLRSDEWAGRTYEVYCEVWRSQQEPLSPQFLRAICPNGVRVVISARINSVTYELGMVQARTGSPNSEWLKAATASFSRNMEMLYSKWQQAGEMDAKSLEYMLAAAPNNPAVDNVAWEIVLARTRQRKCETRLLSLAAKVTAAEQALSGTQVRPPDPYRIKNIEQYLGRLNREKQEFERRLDQAQIIVSTAVSRSAAVIQRPTTNPLGAALNQVPDVSEPGWPETRESIGGPLQQREDDRIEGSRSASNFKYRSPLRRAILVQLIKNPGASNLQVCRGLDADGAIELPADWVIGTNRLFQSVYKSPGLRKRLEAAISKVRADLRKQRLLD
jgi:hypothetical protein